MTSRKDTVAPAPAPANQIPTVLVKPKPATISAAVAAQAINVNLPLKVPVKPSQMIVRPISVLKPSTPYEINKLFNEMKNSKKPFMTIKMKAPAKQSMFPDPFSLFDDDNRYFVFGDARFVLFFYFFLQILPLRLIFTCTKTVFVVFCTM